MTLSAGTVSLGVKADTKGFGSDLHNSLMGDSGIMGAGKAVGGMILGGIAAVGIAAGIGSFIKTGMGEMMDASAGNAQLAAGIKSTGNAAGVTVDSMNAMASSIQNMSGQTDDSITKSQQLLLTFTNIKNNGPDKIFDQATLASANMAAKMGGDAAGSAVMLGKALNDPVKGVAALTRVGVTFTDGQKESIKSMQDMGDMAGAQKIILGELNTEFGGAAEAAGNSLPGMIERGKRAFEDLSQTMAEMLLPVLVPVLGGMVTLLQGALPHVQAFGRGVGDAFALIKGAFTGTGADVEMGKLTNPLIDIGAGLRTVFDAAKNLLPAFGPLVPQVVALASAFSPVQLVLKAILPALPGLVSLFGSLAATTAGALGAALTAILPSITRLAGTLSTDLANTLVALLPVIVQLATLGVAVLTGTLLTLLPMITSVSTFLADNAHLVLGAIAAYMGFQAVNAVIAASQAVQLGFASASYGSAAASYVSGTAAKIGALGYAIMNSTLVTGVATWIASTAAQLANTNGGILAKAVVLGSAIATGVATAAQWLFNAALSANPIGIVVVAIGALVAGLIWVATQTTFFQDAWKATMAFVVGAAKVVGDVVGAAFGAIGSVVSGAFNGVVGFVKGYINTIIDLVNGVIGNINGIGAAVKGATGGAIDIHVGKIPKLAEGGIVPATPGGRLVRVAEAGQDEMIVPLSKARSVLGDGNGGGNGDTYNIYEATSARATAMQVSRRQNALGAV